MPIRVVARATDCLRSHVSGDVDFEQAPNHQVRSSENSENLLHTPAVGWLKKVPYPWLPFGQALVSQAHSPLPSGT